MRTVQPCHTIGLLLVALLALSSGGCGGRGVSAQAMAAPAAAIHAAEITGVEANPDAAAHLKMARDQVAFAKSLVQQGEREQAERVLARAEADAELALALARAESARAEAQQWIERARALRRGAP